MLHNACLLAKIGADAAENEQKYSEILTQFRDVIGGISTPIGGIGTPLGGFGTPHGGISTPVGGDPSALSLKRLNVAMCLPKFCTC